MQYNSIKINKSQGELVKTQLLKLNMFDTTRTIEREGDYLYIPVNLNFNPDKMKNLSGFEYQLLEKECPKRKIYIRSYREKLASRLSSDLIESLPRAYDVIGHVAIIKIPEGLDEVTAEIGESIISTNKNIQTVFRSSGVHRKYRILELQHIAGKEESLTTHKEYGINLELDMRKVYFSPRLAAERFRVAKRVSKGELIIDMFAGVGPFSVMMAKKSNPTKIYAIDFNPDAIYFLQRNIKLNAVSNVEAVEGDARQCIKNLEHYGNFDRVIMNLPHSGFDYLQDAISALRNLGTIHYYEILDNSRIDERKSGIEQQKFPLDITLKIIESHNVHSYSPKDSLIGFDIEINKNGGD
jgi:tRNA (guanine37-N1)-methyltransferase